MADDGVVPDGCDDAADTEGSGAGVVRDELAELGMKLALDELQQRLEALIARAQSLVGRAGTLVGSATIVGAIVGFGGAPAVSDELAWSFFRVSLGAALLAAASGISVLFPQPEENVSLSVMRNCVKSRTPEAGMNWVFDKKLQYYNRLLRQQIWRWWFAWVGFILLLIAVVSGSLGAGARWLFP